MLKRLSFLVSMSFMGILMVLFIVAMALATFVESSYGTETAKAVFYGTRWFHLLLILIGINIVGAIIKVKSYKRPKITVFVFHISFVLILVGAGITRFISFEGMMHIREGDSSSVMISSENYMKVDLRLGDQTSSDMKRTRLSELTQKSYGTRMRVGGEKVTIKSTEFIANAVEQYVAMPGGKPFVQLIAVTDQRVPVGIPSGESRSLFGMDISFNNPDSTAILSLESEGNALYGFTPFRVTTMKMGDQLSHSYEPFDTIHFEQGTVYSFGHLRIALQRYMPSARMQLVRADTKMGRGYPNAVKLEIKYRGMTSEQFVSGYSRASMRPIWGKMGDLEYVISYGSKDIPIPFALELRDFKIERYPGSNSPSSFASEVTLIDNEMGIRDDRKIYMNNVLKHRGYRFYQSSYDNDEKGTVLSVNKDWWGTTVTYIGYFFLMLGMLLALIDRGTRFSGLARRTAGATSKAAAILLLLAISTSSLWAQSIVPPKDIANEFGTLWVQDHGGRFKPINTLSGEIVRKVTGKSRYKNYTTDQVLLGMVLYPNAWQDQPLFEVKSAELQRMTGYRGKNASFNNFVDSIRGYLLSDLVNKAYAKEVPMRDDLDKEVIKLDDRINALYLLQSGDMLRIFPGRMIENEKWYSVSDAMSGKAKEVDTLGVAFLKYLDFVQKGEYQTASQYLLAIDNYQHQFPEMLPGEKQKRVEILYNKSNIFPRLGKFYGLFGLILIVVQIIRTFRTSRLADALFKIGVIHLVVAFTLHTLLFAARWYVSGRAPLSNGYESMIFVSWVTLLAGLIFTKRSGFSVALTAILAALSLIVANMSWMNPEITNLVPVLKSVWLTIHVTVVMAGYGFLGMAALMGLTSLVFYALINPGNQKRILEVVDQLTIVNQMTLIIGLYFLTAGVFLGGVWANESWGRYWGWDPKETWALISVMVYAFITHMHRIPGLRGNYAYNLASFFGYSSILMTYFGVNYFLGGMHSYAGGSAFSFPWYSYAIVVVLIGIGILAYFRQSAVESASKE